MIVVLAGRTEIVDRSERVERVLRASGPGEFNGELGHPHRADGLRLLRRARAGRGAASSRRAAVREAIATIPALSDLLVTAFAARRQILMRSAAATLTMIGPEESAERPATCRSSPRATTSPTAGSHPSDPVRHAGQLHGVAAAAGGGAGPRPRAAGPARADATCNWPRRSVSIWPSTRRSRPISSSSAPVPPGWRPRSTAPRRGWQTIAVDDVAIGGQAGTSSRIENYLGFPTGISGGDLAFRAEVQAVKFGARVTVPRQATALTQENGCYVVRLDDKTDLRGRSVVIATGARYRRLDLPNQEQFEGAGIYYAATDLEARRCRNAEVVVVGGGNSAGQAAMFLAETARRVHLVYRGADLAHGMSQYLISRLEYAPNVRIHLRSEVADAATAASGWSR